MLIRPCIYIPSHNNPKTIKNLLEGCLKNSDLPIIVVDYGSEVPVKNLLNSEIIEKSLIENRLSIVRQERNRGKGYAIQTGIKYAVGTGYTHMLTLDEEEQFDASVILPLIEQTVKTPWNLIIGKRKSCGGRIPSNSKFGRPFSEFWIKYETRAKIDDSQSGLRIYPLFFVQNMKFWTRGFNFETEVLIRLLWKKVEITEVPVPLDYPHVEKKLSRHKKISDSVKIALLNVWLVILSLIKEHHSPKEAALALGMGVFVGSTPFFGLHTPIAFLLSLLFRLNMPLLWIGTQISIPPLAPILAFTSINIGLWVTGHSPIGHSNYFTLETAMRFFSFWVFGSLLLGTVLSILTMLFVYFISKRFLGALNSSVPWQGKMRGGKFGNNFMRQVLRLGGLKSGSFCLFFAVPYFYIFAPRGRRASLEYWKVVDPGLNFFQLRKKVLKHFFRFGTLLIEQAYQNAGLPEAVSFKSEGYENIRAISDCPNGGILLGAHVGAWNMALSLLSQFDDLNPFVFLQFESRKLTFNKAHSNHSGSQPSLFFINEKENPILDIYSLLKEKKIIGMMGDRPLGNDYELVPFFGKLAVFDKTPFLISAIAKTPVLNSFGFWVGRRSYKFFASPIRQLEFKNERNKQIQIYLWLKDYVNSLEQNLKPHLDQWLNFFPFWSERPASPLSTKTRKERHYLCPQLNI